MINNWINFTPAFNFTIMNLYLHLAILWVKKKTQLWLNMKRLRIRLLFPIQICILFLFAFSLIFDGTGVLVKLNTIVNKIPFNNNYGSSIRWEYLTPKKEPLKEKYQVKKCGQNFRRNIWGRKCHLQTPNQLLLTGLIQLRPTANKTSSKQLSANKRLQKEEN